MNAWLKFYVLFINFFVVNLLSTAPHPLRLSPTNCAIVSLMAQFWLFIACN